MASGGVRLFRANASNSGCSAADHRQEGPVGAQQRALPERQHLDVLAAATTTFWCRFADARPDVALGLEAVERHVDRADGQIAAGPCFDFAPDRGAVGIGPQAHQREQDQLFELADGRAGRYTRHIRNNV